MKKIRKKLVETVNDISTMLSSEGTAPEIYFTLDKVRDMLYDAVNVLDGEEE